MIICQDCDLNYEVVWNNDGQEAPCKFCPRCGSEELKTETAEEADETCA